MVSTILDQISLDGNFNIYFVSCCRAVNNDSFSDPNITNFLIEKMYIYEKVISVLNNAIINENNEAHNRETARISYAALYSNAFDYWNQVRFQRAN